MKRPVTQAGLERQIALMTQEMFDAVRDGNSAMFALAVAKGGDVKARNASGLPLLHVAVRRSVASGDLNWIDLVLPYVDDLFVTTAKGKTVFDAEMEDVLQPTRDHSYAQRLRQARVHLMKQMPDIAEARLALNGDGMTLRADVTFVAPKFGRVSKREMIDKRPQDPPTSPDKPPAP